MGLYRFLRVAGGMVLALIIPSLIDLLGVLELSSEFQAVSTLILVPALIALDKILREKGVY